MDKKRKAESHLEPAGVAIWALPSWFSAAVLKYERRDAPRENPDPLTLFSKPTEN